MSAKQGGKKKHSDSIGAVVSFTNTSYRSDANALDLNELVVKNPNSTYFMKIEGEGWSNRGVYPGDVIVIDRSLQVKTNDLIVAEIDGTFEIAKAGDLGEDHEAKVWGVITHTVHKRRQ